MKAILFTDDTVLDEIGHNLENYKAWLTVKWQE